MHARHEQMILFAQGAFSGKMPLRIAHPAGERRK
jgi:hypothetical protein